MLGTKLFAVVLLVGAAFAQTTPSVYEDDEVRIPIPPGWSRATGNYPSIGPSLVNGAEVVGNSVSQAERKLLLQKDGYTLALAYRTGHASGAEGGRFIEAFNIPWLDPTQAETCSDLFTKVPQPANRTLLFENLVLNTGDVAVRAKCGIPKDLATWVGEDLAKRIIGERRWYAGYFTTDRGYFFDESGDEICQSKVYSLTTAAKTPQQLPAAEDAHLEAIIQEAIDIVNGIQYKRCAPKLSFPFR